MQKKTYSSGSTLCIGTSQNRRGVSNDRWYDCLLYSWFELNDKGNMKAPYVGPIGRESTGDRWIPFERQ